MRAVRYDRCGPPGVLRVDEVPTPSPGPGEVHAASVDAGEIAFRAGRLRWMTPAGFPRRLGGDFAGRVVEVRAGVSVWQAGDAVWGLMPHLTFGAIADYVAVPERCLSRAPKNLSLLDAAALPVSGTTALTALTALTDKARLAPGERLLVRGPATTRRPTGSLNWPGLSRRGDVGSGVVWGRSAPRGGVRKCDTRGESVTLLWGGCRVGWVGGLVSAASP
ncbi:alcohol dehydrogenase catalytic domain-containing protein [Streptomyces sp. NBC_01288]|uniref:alcohol dehydrogenase catalytic domain-containing protein n=1 Tax=Streptomyces sp. NBC_01288 TaxID=2903814 RepID=UPI003FA398ED